MLEILCSDVAPAPLKLYFANGEVRLQRDLTALLRPHIANAEVASGFGRILFETFRNTHQWGRHRVDGVPIRNGIRGFTLRRSLGVLDLTVFDAGAGLVRRSLGIKDLGMLTLEEERQACLACFAKRVSSSDLAHRGMGLYISLCEINRLGGSLSVRTGRLLMSRNFHADPFEESSSVSLNDWVSGPDVAGTVLTFSLPDSSDLSESKKTMTDEERSHALRR